MACVLRHWGAGNMRAGDRLFRRHAPAVIRFFRNKISSDLSPSPSLMVAERREHQLLLVALRRIPLMYQVALELHCWEAMTAREVAETLEIPLGTALTRLARGGTLLAAQVEALRASVGLTGESADLEAWAAELRATVGPHERPRSHPESHACPHWGLRRREIR